MSQNLINHWQLSNKEVLQDTYGNLIINGWMDIWQRGNVTSTDPNAINAEIASGEYRYRADRFACNNGSNKVFKVDRVANAVPSSYGSATHVRIGVPSYSLRVTPVNTSGSVTDIISIEQPCEGNFAKNFYGKTCTLRFWAFSSAPIGSVFSVYIRTNEPTFRTYVTSFTTTSSTTWQEYSVVVTLPILLASPSTSQPDNYEHDVGITIGWVLASNNTFETSNLNVWTNSDVYAANTQSNFMASTAYTFYLTCVEFRVGDLTKDDIPYMRRTYTQELELCQRYCEKSYDIETSPGTVSNNGYIRWEGNGERFSNTGTTSSNGTPAHTHTVKVGGVGGGDNATFVRFSVRKRVAINDAEVYIYDLDGNIDRISYAAVHNIVPPNTAYHAGETGFHLEHLEQIPAGGPFPTGTNPATGNPFVVGDYYVDAIGANDLNCHYLIDAEL